ncbi:hypothetical protein OAW57_01420 [Flavobacteriales bacterium]|nr:hypothetical protein [Flavobacteriales bacterium]
MKSLTTLCLALLTMSAVAQISYPYNPDENADAFISTPDLMEFLVVFGYEFEPAEIQVDSIPLSMYLSSLEAMIEANALPQGTTPGQFLQWNGEEWQLVMPKVGCTLVDACNYDATSNVLDEDKCIMPGTLNDCGCSDIPEGECDCEGNGLDALGVCGGTCSEDADGDGICDDGDLCIGEADECGVCNGPGAVNECGCTGIPEGDCDCGGNQVDVLGVCGGDCVADTDGDGVCDTDDPCVDVPDSDGDGICDDVDDCDGIYDLCGVCNGPGPIYDCGCQDIPEGDCDCAGNEFDNEGNCPDFAADTDGDSLLDSLVSPCAGALVQTIGGVEYELLELGGRCWFKRNLRHLVYLNGDSIPLLQDSEDWQNTAVGSACVYGDPAEYGLLYNWNVGSDVRQVCPQHFGVPSQEDWSSLIEHLGGVEVAGGALKEAGFGHWDEPNEGASNSSGMTVLPNGERGYGPTGFVGLGDKAMLWSSTSSSANGAFRLKLESGSEAASLSAATLSVGYGLRCVRDEAIFGCTDVNFLEFNPTANLDDGSCSIPSIPGCTQEDFVEYDPSANVDDGSCMTLAGCSPSDSLLIDGLYYGVVAIGGDCWLSSNLRATHFANGDSIPLVADPIEWGETDSPAWCSSDNDPSLDSEIGRLYNFHAVEDSRLLCPSGWHVSTDEDWLNLESFIGMPVSELPLVGDRGCDELLIDKLLEEQYCATCTNEYGFNADYIKLRLSAYSSMYVRKVYWWTSTMANDWSPYIRGNRSQSGSGCLTRYAGGGNYGGIGITADKNFGSAVRCVRD